MGKIISVTNQKGGVGKTTTAINLAAGLARLEKRVLLVDLDPQGNATSGLGVDVTSVTSSIYDILVKGLPASDAVIETPYYSLCLIPSSQDLVGAEVELIEFDERNRILEKAFAQIQQQYDCILIDCPPSLSILTINALCASNSVIMPIQCEYFALEGLSQLLRTVELVQGSLNPALEIAGIVLTMSDARTNLTKQVVEEVRKYFPDKAYQTIIPRSIKLSEAPSFGKPIFQYDEKSIGAQSYLSLAEEVIKKNLDGQTSLESNTENTGEENIGQTSVGQRIGSSDS